ncbi:hypothetical protein VitviT2T_004962 [Vitis vinifera]|uniref:Uncharacterized protein n=2 Tax=Vitis vinifera TaxID=29760 RepID=A0ABY9BRI1_VITVI|nr:hypothetical protein VitviT2T_004962 [Vitis vinifera]
MGMPGGYGPYGSSPAGYNPSSAAAAGTQLLMRKLLHPNSWKIVFASLVSRVRVQQSGLLHQIGTFLTCQQVLSTTSPTQSQHVALTPA